jgi:hypothetical protein
MVNAGFGVEALEAAARPLNKKKLKHVHAVVASGGADFSTALTLTLRTLLIRVLCTSSPAQTFQR